MVRYRIMCRISQYLQHDVCRKLRNLLEPRYCTKGSILVEVSGSGCHRQVSCCTSKQEKYEEAKDINLSSISESLSHSESSSSCSGSEELYSVSLSSSQWIVIGQPKRWRAATNDSAAPHIGPDGWSPSIEKLCNAGNTCVTLSPTSPCRAVTVCSPISSDR